MEEKQYKFGKQFKSVTKASSKAKGKGDAINCSVQTQYMTCAVTSFLFLALYGALAIRVRNSCRVQDWEGRCCHCWAPDAASYDYRMVGQTMPLETILNDVFYGIVMILNSVFGVYYVYSGVRSENKYLLSIMVLTQLLENGRGLLDVISEQLSEDAKSNLPPQLLAQLGYASDGLILAREVMITVSCALMFCGFFFLRPLYKKFGWRIFRRGGAKRQVREMYKAFQRYRACNLLDIQSSFLLFVIYLLYLDVVGWNYYWVFCVMFISDVLASRAMVKFMKQEDPRGFVICIIAKLSVIIWWVCILGVYLSCYYRYARSLDTSEPYFQRISEENWVRAPSLWSVVDTYNGLNCLRPGTSHDARTFELITLNFIQAFLFRLISLFLAHRVYRNFGEGLREVFYKDVKSSADQKADNLVTNGDGEPNSDDGKWDEEEDDEAPPSGVEMNDAA